MFAKTTSGYEQVSSGACVICFVEHQADLKIQRFRFLTRSSGFFSPSWDNLPLYVLYPSVSSTHKCDFSGKFWSC